MIELPIDMNIVRANFEEYEAKFHSDDKSTRLPNGNYSGWMRQERWTKHKTFHSARGLEFNKTDFLLTQEERDAFRNMMQLTNPYLIWDWQDDKTDKLIIPSGQGKSVPLAILCKLETFKYMICYIRLLTKGK